MARTNDTSSRPAPGGERGVGGGGGGGSGCGGGGRKKPRVSTPLAAPLPQHQPASLTGLPAVIYPQLMAFLPRWDRESLRRVSKAVRERILSSTHTLVLPLEADCRTRKPQALVDLLQRMKGLQQLSTKTESLTGGEAERLLVAAIGEGQAGATLRTLELGELDGALMLPLIGHLRDRGRLPLLTELQLPYFGDGDGFLGAAVAGMVEARGALQALEKAREAGGAGKGKGKPSINPSIKWSALTRLEGVASLQPESLRRIWACCPPGKVTHLEVSGGP